MRAPLSFLLKDLETDLNGIDAFEVGYIGQALGRKGQRTAIERLSSHSTLQKILADIYSNEPHMEVLLALYSFEFYRFILSMNGIDKSVRPDDADRVRYHRILESQFERSMQICMAEAALIRYFEPSYNKIYKTGFPHSNLKILRKIYELDFAALIVEASIEDHHMTLFSNKQNHPLSHHIA